MQGLEVRNSPEWRIENLKGTITLAAQTIKSLELINGAAAVGLLTFYGHVAVGSTASSINRCALIVALVSFGLGVLSATICGLAAYLSQRVVATGSPGETGYFYGAMFFGLSSAACFLGGLIAGGFALK